MITVLVIEDDRALLEMTRQFLERNGTMSVYISETADAALKILNTKIIDAIVSDYQLPDMDGITLLKTLRNTGSRVPFIVFTGRSREQVVIEALNNGADFFLQKGGEPRVQFFELEHMILQATSRKRAEDALRESIHRFTDIINFLPDATLAIDRGGNVIAWNHAMEELTGVPAHHILGRNDLDYSLAFYGRRWPLLIDLIFASDEEVMNFGYSHVRRKGCTLIAESTSDFPSGTKTLWAIATPLFDERGGVAGAIESIRDISDLRMAEEARSRSEAKFRGIFEFSPTPIAIFDGKGRLLELNRACRELGFPGNGQKSYNLFRSAIFPAGCRETLSRGEAIRFEIAPSAKEGNELVFPSRFSAWFEVLVTPFFTSRETPGMGILVQFRETPGAAARPAIMP